MKDIDDMRIGESFYLKMTVAVISTRTGRPCEFDEERIDINDLIIAELEKIKAEMKEERDSIDLSCADSFNWNIRLIDKHISEIKGETK